MKKSGTGKHCATTVTPAKNMTYFSDMEFICYDILKNTATIVKERRFDYYGLQFVRSGEIKVMFDDGSSWQISDCGYNERFDAQGECIGSNHYDCDSAHWEMLIQNYIHSPMP